MKKKNILLVIGCSKIGGAQKVFVTLAKELRKEGNVVIILLPNGPLAERLQQEDFNTMLIKFNTIEGLRTIARLFKRYKFDIINTHLTNASFFIAIINIFYKNKLCCSLHNAIIHEGLNWFQKLIYPFIYFILYKLSSGFIVNSESNKRHFIDIARIDPNHIRVIYNGIDPRDYVVQKNMLNVKRKKFQIGFIGRLSIEKGVVYLIEALAQLKDIDFECVIVGEGPLKENLEHVVFSNGLNGKIKFVGFQQNVVPYFVNMDVFVLPSINEVMPITIIEAFALKVATIASEVGGVPDLITHGKTGMLFPARDVERLVENIKWLYLNEAERMRIIDCAYLRFANSFTSGIMIRETVDYFNIIKGNEKDCADLLNI